MSWMPERAYAQVLEAMDLAGFVLGDEPDWRRLCFATYDALEANHVVEDQYDIPTRAATKDILLAEVFDPGILIQVDDPDALHYLSAKVWGAASAGPSSICQTRARRHGYELCEERRVDPVKLAPETVRFLTTNPEIIVRFTVGRAFDQAKRQLGKLADTLAAVVARHPEMQPKVDRMLAALVADLGDRFGK